MKMAKEGQNKLRIFLHSIILYIWFHLGTCLIEINVGEKFGRMDGDGECEKNNQPTEQQHEIKEENKNQNP